MKKGSIVRLNQQCLASFLLSQMLDADKEYKNILIKRNPIDYYKLDEMRCYYEGIYGTIKAEVRALSGIKFIKDDFKDESIQSYSMGSYQIFSGNMNSDRNITALNKLIIEHNQSDKTSIRLDTDVSVYSLYGKDNDLSYTPLSINLDDYIEGVKKYYVNNFDFTLYNTTHLNRFSKEFISLANVKDMLEQVSLQVESGNEFVRTLVGEANAIDYTLSTFSVNSCSLLDLANNIVEENNFNPNKKTAVASAILAKALNDPNDIITHTTLKGENGGFKASTAIVNKNYDYLIKRCNNSHNRVVRFFHSIFFFKYDEEKKEVTSRRVTQEFLQNNTLDSISNNFMARYQNEIKNLETVLNLNSKKQVDVDDLKNNKVCDNKITNEINNVKEINVNNDLNKDENIIG